MKRSDFIDKTLKPLQDEETRLNLTKGEAYTVGSPDCLANFKRIGERLGLSPLMVCAVYMDKHFSALMHYAKTGTEVTGETAFKRAADLRLFAALFCALAAEDAGSKKESHG